MDVLQKILNAGRVEVEVPKDREQLVQDFLTPPRTPRKVKLKQRGRPKLEDQHKAKNFTLCLAPQYLAFLDNLKVKDDKVQGRGRKVRYIIDQFIELQNRQKTQLAVLKEGLTQVELKLKSLSTQVKKGQKLELSTKEKNEISKAVKQALIIIKVLGYSPKVLHGLLPRPEWALVSFCLDWSKKMDVTK